jgi:hypothetical protein
MTEEDFGRVVTRHKGALTRAQRSGDPMRVLAAARAALADFEQAGMWPDAWSRWECARQDALWTLQRERVSP